MKCDQSCANPAEYRIHRTGFPPKNVCGAHLYVAKHNAQISEFTVQPLTFQGHITAFVNTPSTVPAVVFP